MHLQVYEKIDEISVEEEQNHLVTDGMVVLGKKINDPYDISNMRSALLSLKSAGYDFVDDDIQPNMKYI